MLSEIFYWALNMSISASIAGVIVCLLGKIQRIPRTIASALWIIPFLRMWIPIGMNSKYSLMTLMTEFTSRTVVINERYPSVTVTNHVVDAETYFPVTYKTNVLEEVYRTAGVVWIIIAAALFLAMAIIYAVTMSEIKDAERFRDNIYISDKVTSPAAYGVFVPKIILPKVYANEDLQFVLMHENVHIKRRDNLRRILAIATACVHWFNPLSWLFLKSYLASIELACDEKVLAACGEDKRKKYAATLLSCVESKSVYASPFGGAKVRVRIERILSYKRLSALSTAAFVAFGIVVGYVLLTNAK